MPRSWARSISAFKTAARRGAARSLRGPSGSPPSSTASIRRTTLAQALYAAKISSYAQGMALLRQRRTSTASSSTWPRCAPIWTGGCIIRARLLGTIQSAFKENAGLTNLMLDAGVCRRAQPAHGGIARGGARRSGAGSALPGDERLARLLRQLPQERLPANLIQGQRDYFGAHTYERVDKPGIFHTEWPVGAGRPKTSSGSYSA